MNINQGIYKITSPNGRIYIGQSSEMDIRFKSYKRLSCKSQVRLYNSFVKHGLENHKFEVIELCSEELLNDRERYYQDLYDVIGTKGLNCKLTATQDRSGKLSEDMKKKLSKAHRGKKLSAAHKEKIRIAGLGKKISPEAKEKISKAQSKRVGECRRGINNGHSIKVICIAGSRIFNSIREASSFIGMNRIPLQLKLKGNRKNNTSMRYYLA